MVNQLDTIIQKYYQPEMLCIVPGIEIDRGSAAPFVWQCDKFMLHPCPV